MKENKNIDQFFKERFDNFEATPPPAVWNNIQAQMAENKCDRKVIPLWWKLGGIAAALVLLLTVGNFVFNPSQTNNSIEVAEETIEKIPTNENIKNVNNEDATQVDGADIFKTENNTSIAIEENSTHANTTKNTSNNKQVVTTREVTNVSNKDALSYVLKEDKVDTNTERDAILKNDPLLNTTKISETNKNLEKTIIPDTNKEEGIQQNKILDKTVKTEVATEKTKTDLESGNKKSIFDAINETEEAVAKTKEPILNRWAVSPTVAPVYYSSIEKGSSIDPMFADNNQSGAINVSYGVNISYQINDKLSVRSGLANVKLGYATSGVELGTGDATAALMGVTYNNEGGVILTAVDSGRLDNTSAESPYSNLTKKATSGEVLLNQNLSYLEIPMELKYNVTQSKFGVSVIGGFSTLLLGDNSINVTANGFESEIGQANNLNDVSFTTNVGLGLTYALAKRFQFNIEPMFKYQLNPYTDNSVSYKPYYVGVYSGLSFKF